MRVLIDESLPRELLPLLEGHEARTVQQEGWSSISNGELLRRAAQAGYQVLLTPDRNLQYQQNISRAGVAVVVLRAPTNRIEDLMQLIPQFFTPARRAETRNGQGGRAQVGRVSFARRPTVLRAKSAASRSPPSTAAAVTPGRAS